MQTHLKEDMERHVLTSDERVLQKHMTQEQPGLVPHFRHWLFSSAHCETVWVVFTAQAQLILPYSHGF